MTFLSEFNLDHETLTFRVNNLNPTFLNSLRRLIISHVETVSFRTEYGQESDIKIETNTSSIHNEMLAHRLSLVPIHVDTKKISDFNSSKLEFFIDVTNNTTKTMDITSKHIQIRDVSKEPSVILSETETRKYFPPDRITGGFILINKLKPNNSGILEEGESMVVIMKANKSIGKEHARYCPTCVSVFTNLRDDEKIKKELQKRISEKNLVLSKSGKNEMSEEAQQELIKSFMVSEADRYFHTGSDGEPNVFEFTIESDGRIPPYIIFDRALFVLEEQIVKFIKKLEDPEQVKVENSDCIMHSFDLIFDDEDYTMAYLIQYYMFKLFQNVEEPKVKYVAGTVPHPLENKMVLRVALEDSNLSSDYIKTLIKESCSEIKKIIHLLKNEMKASKVFILDR